MRDEQWREFIDRLIVEAFNGNASALARQIGASGSTVSRWRSGETKTPTPDAIKKMLSKLAASPSRSVHDLVKDAYGFDLDTPPRGLTLDEYVAAEFKDPKVAKIALAFLAALREEDQPPPPNTDRSRRTRSA